MAKSRSALLASSKTISKPTSKPTSNSSPLLSKPTTHRSKITKPSQTQHPQHTPLSAHSITSPTPLPPTTVPSSLPDSPAISTFQHRVLSALLQIPAGRVTTYGQLAKALHSAPRAVGGALRRNPWAPAVPCHRVVQESGYIGGFMGSIAAAPSGVNCERKLRLLAGEGVRFDERGYLLERERLWDESEFEFER